MGAPGQFVQSQQGHQVFVPAKPEAWPLEWSAGTQRLIEEAENALGRASGSSLLIPNPGLLTLASLDKEAIASSTIENTVASPEEFVLYQAVGGEARSATVEVANYRHALQHGIQRLSELPISTRFVLELHERLLTKTSRAQIAGMLKTHQNYIAPDKSFPIEEATFVPPPPEMVGALLDDLWTFVHNDRQTGRVAKIAVSHYQFETIHPFGDGNGRVGRLLIVLQLIESGLLDTPCVYPSLYFERNKDEYLDRLQAVRDRADLDQWIGFFARALAASARNTVQLAQDIRAVVAELEAGPSGVRRKAALRAAVGVFASRLSATAPDVARLAGISGPTAQSCIRELVEDGTLREVTGKRRGRLYICQPLFRVIFG